MTPFTVPTAIAGAHLTVMLAMMSAFMLSLVWLAMLH